MSGCYFYDSGKYNPTSLRNGQEGLRVADEARTRFRKPIFQNSLSLGVDGTVCSYRRSCAQIQNDVGTSHVPCDRPRYAYRLSPLNRCLGASTSGVLLSPQPSDQVSILSRSDRPGTSQCLIELFALGSNSRKGMRRHLFTG
jgi:hypothetical protein